MTICVGILCKDGVVLASDTMASSAVAGFYNKKIYNINNKYACAIAGSDSLSKLLIHQLELDQNKYDDPYQLAFVIAYNMRNPIIAQNPGIQSAINNILCAGQVPQLLGLESMIGFEMAGKFYIAYFGGGWFNPSITKQDDRIFCTIIGSGITTSSPLINLLCDMLSIKGQPTIKQAKLLAYWLVKYAIDNSPAYIGGSIDMLQLSNAQEPVVEEISVQECQEFQQDFMTYIQNYSQGQKAPAKDIPK